MKREFNHEQLEKAVLSDEELDNVAGGGHHKFCPYPSCPQCNSNEHVIELHLSGFGPSGEYFCQICDYYF